MVFPPDSAKTNIHCIHCLHIRMKLLVGLRHHQFILKIRDSADSAEVLKAVAEAQTLDEMQSLAADVNGDGAADSSDAAEILQFAAEILQFAAEQKDSF